MKINGYNLFESSLTKFNGEEKKTPDEILVEFIESEEAIAKLQTAQIRYNLVKNGDISLAEAIKRIGGIGRIEKIWKAASKPIKKGRYGSIETAIPTSKSKDTEYAQRTVSFEDALSKASAAGKEAALREAIAIGNGRELDTDLSPTLFGE